MAWLRRLLFLLVLPMAAYGQGVRYDNFVIKPLSIGGLTAVSGALITVCTSAGTGTPCTPKVANIYSDEALTTPIVGTGGAGTTNSDAGGNFGFYAAPGSYIITVTGTGITSYTIKVTLPIVGAATSVTFTGTVNAANVNGQRTVDCVNTKYVCTGGDLGVGVAAAVADCPSTGCTIVIPSGSYTWTASQIIGSSAVSNVKPITLYLRQGAVINENGTGGIAPIRLPNRSGIICEQGAGDNGAYFLLGASANVNSMVENADFSGAQAYTFIENCLFQGNVAATVAKGLVFMSNLGIQSNLHNVLVYQSPSIGLYIKSVQGFAMYNIWANQNTTGNILVEDSYGANFYNVFAENPLSATGYCIKFLYVSDAGSVAMSNQVFGLHTEYTPAAADTNDALVLDGVDTTLIYGYTTTSGGANPMRSAIRVLNTNASTNRLGFILDGFHHLSGGLTDIIFDTINARHISTAVFGSRIPGRITWAGQAATETGNYLFCAAAICEEGVQNAGAGNFWNFASNADGTADVHIRGNAAPMKWTTALNTLTVPLQFTESTSAGAGVGFDTCYGDSTAHALECSYNNGSFSVVPLQGRANTFSAIQAFPSNTAALTADWTCGTAGTVSSCVAATIIGSGGGVPLTFTLPLVAQSYTLECDGVVGQATAVTANQWNLLTATNGATNVTANYTMATAATAFAAGAVTDQASTTTTFQIAPSWTLGAIGTKMPFHIYAKIEGASASGTVVSLQLVAPTVADLVTIYRGASCRIF